MKIQLQSDGKPFEVSPSIITRLCDVKSEPDSRIYIQLAPQSKEIPRRHQGELVLRNGWVNLDYDQEGFLVGFEITEGDPFSGVTECISYLQPINPLAN